MQRNSIRDALNCLFSVFVDVNHHYFLHLQLFTELILKKPVEAHWPSG